MTTSSTAMILEQTLSLESADCLENGRKNILAIHSQILELKESINKLIPIQEAAQELAENDPNFVAPEEIQQTLNELHQAHTEVVEQRHQYASECDKYLAEWYNKFWDQFESKNSKLQIKRTMFNPNSKDFIPEIGKVLRENAHVPENKIAKYLSTPKGIIEAIQICAKAVNGLL